MKSVLSFVTVSLILEVYHISFACVKPKLCLEFILALYQLIYYYWGDCWNIHDGDLLVFAGVWNSPRHCLVILYRYRFMRIDKYLCPYFTFCSVFIITNIVVLCYGHCLSSVALCFAVENINWAYICVDMIFENPISYIWNSYGNSFKMILLFIFMFSAESCICNPGEFPSLCPHIQHTYWQVTTTTRY